MDVRQLRARDIEPARVVEESGREDRGGGVESHRSAPSGRLDRQPAARARQDPLDRGLARRPGRRSARRRRGSTRASRGASGAPRATRRERRRCRGGRASRTSASPPGSGRSSRGSRRGRSRPRRFRAGRARSRRRSPSARRRRSRRDPSRRHSIGARDAVEPGAPYNRKHHGSARSSASSLAVAVGRPTRRWLAPRPAQADALPVRNRQHFGSRSRPDATGEPVGLRRPARNPADRRDALARHSTASDCRDATSRVVLAPALRGDTASGRLPWMPRRRGVARSATATYRDTRSRHSHDAGISVRRPDAGTSCAVARANLPTAMRREVHCGSHEQRPSSTLDTGRRRGDISPAERGPRPDTAIRRADAFEVTAGRNGVARTAFSTGSSGAATGRSIQESIGRQRPGRLPVRGGSLAPPYARTSPGPPSYAGTGQSAG